MSLTTQRAKEIQEELRSKIEIEAYQGKLTTVAGADISFNRSSDVVYAGIVILSLPDLTEVARSLVITKTSFPYIPGLLAFRELPPLMKAWEQLKRYPDVVILDGHGLAHPRRMGIATHFGIKTDHPAIGCAKNLLTGTYKEPDPGKESFEYIKDGDENIGIALRSRSNVNPIFVSPGHKVSFKDARSIIMKCVTGYKLPETTRKAHELVNKLRREEVKPGYFSY